MNTKEAGAALVLLVVAGAAVFGWWRLAALPHFLECNPGISVKFSANSVTVNGFEAPNPTITDTWIAVTMPDWLMETGKGTVSVSIDRITGRVQLRQGTNKQDAMCRARADRAF
jgi:hypothetical protein